MAHPPRRVNVVDGQLLTAEDLMAVQEYHRGMRYLHNRLHGYGTASGLEVAVVDGRVRVDAGMAIDVLGREIVVTDGLSLPLDVYAGSAQEERDLVIVWREVPAEARPGVDGVDVFTRWVELPELVLVPVGTAPQEGLVLARLAWTDDGAVDVDTSVRRPLDPA